MRWIALLTLILCSGCHVARATVTYQFDQPTISFTLEPNYDRQVLHRDNRQDADRSSHRGSQGQWLDRNQPTNKQTSLLRNEQTINQ